MKKQILVEDRPPLEGEALVLFVLPLAIAVLAGVTVTMLIW
jgi:cytochrome c-type biogenesis protein CcmH/NrfF